MVANSFSGVEKSFAVQAGREIRIFVEPARISDDEAGLVAFLRRSGEAAAESTWAHSVHVDAAGLRPDIVWFGEMPYEMEEIEDAVRSCDLFVSIGTSGAVYPAAGFVQSARYCGARTLEMNLEPSLGSYLFDESRIGKAGELVPAWVEEMLAADTGPHRCYASPSFLRSFRLNICSMRCVTRKPPNTITRSRTGS